MTMLGEKLKKAGVNTAEARLMALAIDAMREADGSVSEAAIALWAKLKNESWVAKELWLVPYLQERKRDMEGNAASTLRPAPRAIHGAGKEPATQSPRPSERPPSHSREQREKRQVAVRDMMKKIVHAVKFGCLTSDGRDWAQVGAHELDGMLRDGALARAVKDKLGVLTNAQKFMPIGEIITPELFRQAQKEALIL